LNYKAAIFPGEKVLIRHYKSTDLDEIMDIWFKTNLTAHNSVKKDYFFLTIALNYINRLESVYE